MGNFSEIAFILGKRLIWPKFLNSHVYRARRYISVKLHLCHIFCEWSDLTKNKFYWNIRCGCSDNKDFKMLDISVVLSMTCCAELLTYLWSAEKYCLKEMKKTWFFYGKMAKKSFWNVRTTCTVSIKLGSNFCSPISFVLVVCCSTGSYLYLK